MKTTIGQKLFDPTVAAFPGETPEQAAKRVEANGQIFRNALNGPAGRKLVKLLYSVSHPLEQRFRGGNTPEEAAFLDGEKTLIGLLWLNGTTMQDFTQDQTQEDHDD